MSKYDVNIKRFALLLLPIGWRKPLFRAIVYAMTAPLHHLHARFMAFRRTTDYRLTHNGQVCYLRAVLNDQFDPVERRIKITEDNMSTDPMLLWIRSADRAIPLPLRQSGEAVIIPRRGFSAGNAVDFVVEVPLSVGAIDEARLGEVVKTYKLASRRFLITYINE